MFIDTHLHLSKSDYESIETVIENAKKNLVNYLIVSCCSIDEIRDGIDNLLKYDNVFLSIGLHPSESDIYTSSDLEEIKNFVNNNRNKIVAIGEIGLDYHYGKENILNQKELFIKQLDMAKELGLPVVIHTRDATNDTINILKQYDLKGVIHCFSGSLETANIYIKMGYKLGIGGVITFKNSHLPDVVKEIGLSSIVLETDSPYLAPVPHRGEKNEPKYIPIIAQCISDITSEELETVAFETSSNACDVFDLNI